MKVADDNGRAGGVWAIGCVESALKKSTVEMRFVRETVLERATDW